jgi:signal peptidase I
MLGALAVSILLTPIGGYLALGRWRRALGFGAAAGVLVLLALAPVLHGVAWAVGALGILQLGLFVGAIVHVGHLVRRTPAGQVRWGLALGGALALTLLLGASRPVKAHLVESFRSPTGTMLTTLAIGDHFFVDKRRAALARGDIVVFRFPPAPAVEYAVRVKRVVALAGDTIEMRDGVLLVNRTPVAARPLGTVRLPAASIYVRPKDDLYQEWEEALEARRYRVLRVPGGRRSSFGPVTVPVGSFFMLGDNRDNNNDSRLYDVIPLDSVIGRAVWIWWSSAPEGGVRWERLGRRL